MKYLQKEVSDSKQVNLFKTNILTETDFNRRKKAGHTYDQYNSYSDYVNGIIANWGKEGKLSNDESEYLKAYYGFDSNFKFNVDNDYIQSFIKDAKGYLDTSSKNASNIGYSNALQEYENNRKSRSELLGRSGIIRGYLNNNKDNIGEEQYNELIGFLNSFDKGSSDVVDFYSKNADYFSQWESEDAYNKAVEEYNQYKQIEEYDFESGKSEIDYLNKLYAKAQQVAKESKYSDNTSATDKNSHRKAGLLSNSQSKSTKKIKLDTVDLARRRKEKNGLRH